MLRNSARSPKVQNCRSQSKYVEKNQLEGQSSVPVFNAGRNFLTNQIGIARDNARVLYLINEGNRSAILSWCTGVTSEMCEIVWSQSFLRVFVPKPYFHSLQGEHSLMILGGIKKYKRTSELDSWYINIEGSRLRSLGYPWVRNLQPGMAFMDAAAGPVLPTIGKR